MESGVLGISWRSTRAEGAGNGEEYEKLIISATLAHAIKRRILPPLFTPLPRSPLLLSPHLPLALSASNPSFPAFLLINPNPFLPSPAQCPSPSFPSTPSSLRRCNEVYVVAFICFAFSAPIAHHALSTPLLQSERSKSDAVASCTAPRTSGRAPYRIRIFSVPKVDLGGAEDGE